MNKRRTEEEKGCMQSLRNEGKIYKETWMCKYKGVEILE